MAFLIVVLAAAITLATPSPPQAKANLACDAAGGVGGAVTGALGIGNPVGDVCETVTKPLLSIPNPLDVVKDAASSVGRGIFGQITNWVADGAVWLMGRVAALMTETTSPDLLSKGFLREYRQMASIAAVLAVAMVMLAALECLGRSDGAMLWRVVLVHVPVAALAMSAAYVVVQLLIATTDGFSEVVARSTSSDLESFFKSAIGALAITGGATGAAAGGPGGGAAGAVAVPLFVGFIVSVVAALAAFLIWIELLMRDAAIYAVALFMPLAIAASIWPRWTGTLRRTAELLLVVIASKFVIVSIIALAASLLSHSGGRVEQVLAASALMLLACFAPVVLFRLVPFAEGAIGSTVNRQSASGSAAQGIRTASSSVQMVRRAARSNWSGGGGTAGRQAASGNLSGASGVNGAAAGNGSVAGGEGAAAAGGGAGVGAVPVALGIAAAKGSKAAAERLASTGVAETSSGGAAGGSGRGAAGGGRREEQAASGDGDGAVAGPAAEPAQASGGSADSGGAKPPRPSSEVRAADTANSSGNRGSS